ncbi:MAG: HEAT repeat domain-containing protein [Endomicrobiia bacterium]
MRKFIVLISSLLLVNICFSEKKEKPVDPFDQAVKNFNSSDPYIKISAIDQFVVLKDMRAVSYLKKSLKDKNTFVRQRTLEALGSLRVKDAVKDIAEILLKDNVPSVQQSAVGALGVIGSAEALPVLHQVLKSTNTPIFVRYSICEKLRIFRSTTSVPVLISLLKEEDIKLKRSAVIALNSIVHSDVLPTLRKLLETEKDEDILCDVMQFLTTRNDTESLPKIKSFLNSSSEKTKIYSAISIAKLGKDTTAIPVLKSNLNHSNPVIKNMVIEAIGFVGDKEILTTLKTMLEKEQDFYVKEMLKISIFRIENSLPATETKPSKGTKK